MIRPPLIMKFRIKGDRPRFGCWLPLFLLLPLLLLFFVLLLPLFIIVVLVLWPLGWGRTALMAVPALFQVLSALRGLKVQIKDGVNQVDISVI